MRKLSEQDQAIAHARMIRDTDPWNLSKSRAEHHALNHTGLCPQEFKRLLEDWIFFLDCAIAVSPGF